MTKIIYHPFIAFITTVVAVVFFVSLDKSSQKTELSAKNIEILEGDVQEMSSDVIKLEEEIIRTDSEIFKEKVIRNELLLQKPGEYIIRLPDLGDGETAKLVDSKKSEPMAEWMKLIGI